MKETIKTGYFFKKEIKNPEFKCIYHLFLKDVLQYYSQNTVGPHQSFLDKQCKLRFFQEKLLSKMCEIISL